MSTPYFFRTAFGIMSVIGIVITLFVIAIVVYVFVRVIRASRSASASAQMIRTAADAAFQVSQNQDDLTPRSLSACESIVLPKILADFPGFNLDRAYAEAEDALSLKLSEKNDLTIHKVALTDYCRSRNKQKALFQAAVQFRENGVLKQKRYLLDYTYRVSDGKQVVAPNCPNCGAPISDFHRGVCPYCDSLLYNPLNGNWFFSDVREG